MAKIEGETSVADVVEELVKLGILPDADGCRIIDQVGDRPISIEVTVDPDEIVEEASTKTLTEAARDRDDYEPDNIDADIVVLAEAITAVRCGNLNMASILFERALAVGDVLPIFQALRA